MGSKRIPGHHIWQLNFTRRKGNPEVSDLHRFCRRQLENSVLENDKKPEHGSGYVRLLVIAITIMNLFVATGTDQGPPLAIPQISPATHAIPWGGLGVGVSLSTPATAGSIDWQASDVPLGELTVNAASTDGSAVHLGGVRRITLEADLAHREASARLKALTGSQH